MNLLVLVWCHVANAGPVPSFQGRVVPMMPVGPPVAAPPSGPAVGRSRFFAVPTPWFGPTAPAPANPASPWVTTLDDDPKPSRPPALPYVKAAPIKTRVENPGQFIPIDQLPSPFVPLTPASTELRPVTPPQTTVRPRGAAPSTAE